jgi:hypothetical protein
MASVTSEVAPWIELRIEFREKLSWGGGLVGLGVGAGVS